LPNPALLDSTAGEVVQRGAMLGLQDEERKEIDSIVADLLGLTRGERDAVYEGVVGLVESRMNKAGSLR